MKKFNGLLVKDNEIIKISRFVCFGEMSDGTKCFHEIDENNEEIEGAWYSMSRRKIDGETYTLFFLEGIE